MHTNITNNNKAFIPNLRSATRALSFYFISFIALAFLFVKLTSIISSLFLSPRSMFVFIPHPWRLIDYSPTTSVNWHANKSLLHISKPYQTIPLLSSSIKVMSNFSTHSFLILSFSLLLLIHLNILISATLIFWMCS